ncbi:MAG: c-type cytochrome [Betaproteobacteria bacterium]
MKMHMLAAAILLVSGTAFAASGDAEAGRKKSQPCQACHGQSGISVAPNFPNLAGQNEDYIVHVLKHYKNGKRKNPIMQGQVANLTDRDILDLAAHFSRLQGLQVKY